MHRRQRERKHRRRTWRPDISKGFNMLSPSGWKIVSISVTSDARVQDGVVITLQRDPLQTDAP